MGHERTRRAIHPLDCRRRSSVLLLDLARLQAAELQKVCRPMLLLIHLCSPLPRPAIVLVESLPPPFPEPCPNESDSDGARQLFLKLLRDM